MEAERLIFSCLKTAYGIELQSLERLSLGADSTALVHRARAVDGNLYFIKTKKGSFQSISAAILQWLEKASISALISPLKTKEGALFQQVGEITCIVYPFIEGQDGFSRPLTQKQWIEFGKVLRQIHEISVPSSLQTRMRREDFSPRWRQAVRGLYDRLESRQALDEMGQQMKKTLQEKKEMILQLLNHAENLSQRIDLASKKFVLCHGDIHAGNLLLADAGSFYIVDWDAPLLAPKERDLMFIGGGVGNVWKDPQEEALFYEGYGNESIDRSLITYYRCERILEDIALYAEELLSPQGGTKEKGESYQQFIAQFQAGGVVDIALKTTGSV